MLKWTLLLLLALNASVCQAQSIPLINYTIDDGFPSNTVYNVYRDKKGYLWFASEIGVVRYNGLKFEHFTGRDGLAGNVAFAFMEDYEGRLWIASYNGELCFYKDGKFHNAGNTSFLQLPFKPFHTRYITVEPDSSITIFYDDPNHIISIKGERMEVISVDKSLVRAGLIYIHKTTDGFELLYLNKRVLINKQGKAIRTTTYKQAREYRYLFYDKQRYLFSDEGVLTLEEQLLQHRTISIPSNYAQYVLSIMQEDSTFFFCTRNGLITKENIHLLKGRQVSAITKDIAGNYWISTIGNGVYQLSKNYNSIQEYAAVYKGNIQHAQVVGGKLYFLSDAAPGCLQLLGDSGVSTITKYKSQKRDQNSYSTWMNFILTPGMDYYGFYSQDRFVACNLNTKQLFTDTAHWSVWNTKRVFIKNDQMFLLTKASVSTIDIPMLKSNRKILAKEIINTEKKGDHIFSWAQDVYNDIWYSTMNNTYKIVSNEGIPQHQLKSKTFKKFVFCGNYLVGIDEQNHLFICNDPYRNTSTDTVNNNALIWGDLYKLDNSHVLLSSNKAYFLLMLSASKAAPKFVLQPVEDAFLPLQAEYVCTDSNYCFFFKKGAIYRIPAKLFFERTISPTISFTTLNTKKGRKRIRDKVEIPYGSAKDIRIEFDVISFMSKELTYQYSISANEQNNWVDINSREINLHNPGFGLYNIKVRVKNIAGQYTSATGFQLMVLKPFWATWQFIAMSVVATLLLLTISIRWAVRRKMLARQRKMEDKIKYQKAEYKALNALMNPHFIFNSINNIQGLINDDNKRGANKYLAIFSHLIRQNMHNVSKGLISIQDEIELTRNYLFLEKLRFKEDIDYNIDIDTNVAIEHIQIPPLLIQPLVENSIKHRPANKAIFIDIKLYRVDDSIYISVSDNGAGLHATRSRPSPYPSFSLSNLENRARHLKELYGQQISIEINEITDNDNIVTGTIAIVKIVLSDR